MLQKYLAQTLRFLAIRSRSRLEVENYLKRKLSPGHLDLLEPILAKIDHFNLLNDADFTQELILSALNHGKGPRLIRYLLQQKGVAPNLILASLEGIDPETMKLSAQALLVKKASRWSLIDRRLFSLKAQKLLFSRGYPSAVSKSVIDEYLHQQVK